MRNFTKVVAMLVEIANFMHLQLETKSGSAIYNERNIPYVALNLGLMKEYYSEECIFWMVSDTILISFESFINKDSKNMHYFLVVLSI